ncbi:unnamed protein product [Onchocerca flexuosa]|uniref:Ovule protein n=1 Tax=Onchocerca flexuosa TaxID=387005 RepID=A0A183I899_9BILA|nr:unnamed protein product [Onchocerca flexuosa]
MKLKILGEWNVGLIPPIRINKWQSRTTPPHHCSRQKQNLIDEKKHTLKLTSQFSVELFRFIYVSYRLLIN